MAGGGRPYFFTPWTDRPRTDRTDQWGHRNKHPLVAESSLDSRNDLQHVIWGDLGGSREGLGEAAAPDRNVVVSTGLRRQDPSHRSPGDRQSIGRLTATPQRVRQNKCQIGSAMGLNLQYVGAARRPSGVYRNRQISRNRPAETRHGSVPTHWSRWEAMRTPLALAGTAKHEIGAESCEVTVYRLQY